MVYRGKPSAGCENCRKAKKRCGLEQPACERCVKLKKVCSGYRDTNSLQIQDESEAVKRKAERQKAKGPTPQPSQYQHEFSIQPPQQQSQPIPRPSPEKAPVKDKFLAPPTVTDTILGIPTPGSMNSDSTSSSDTIDVERDTLDVSWSPGAFDFAAFDPTKDDFSLWIPELTVPVMPKPGDIATTYFFLHFTNSPQWEFMRGLAMENKLDPCLDLALKACGMAALGNAENLPDTLDTARSMYTSALGLLNEALRDPQKCKKDAALIAVSMLGRYENLMCDGRHSIESWKAHIKGSTQLLKVRGKTQFNSQIGRIMYREMRSQAMILAIWDDEYVNPFFRDYEDDLEKFSEDAMLRPVDELTKMCFDFADLRANIRFGRLPHTQAAAQASELEGRFLQWSLDTMAYDERWRYHEMEVDDSEHVWDGKVHAYNCLPAPTVWNTYRNMRIMLTRTQEWISRRIPTLSDLERQEQMQYFRSIRRQMTDEICATIPVSLGNSSPAFSSPCVLVSSYGAVWPLFFAGTCALERIGPRAASIVRGEPLPSGLMFNKAGAQAEWILSRLYYISDTIGLKWADGVAAVLRGDFKVSQHLIDEDDKRPYPQYTKYERALWLKQVEDANRGARVLIEDSGKDDAMDDHQQGTPIWLGRGVGGLKRGTPMRWRE